MIPLALSQNTVNLVYAAAAILLCLGVKRLSSPATARSGNLVAAVGMTIAVVVTLFSPEVEQLRADLRRDRRRHGHRDSRRRAWCA